MEKEISNINVKLELKLNSMTIDEFHKEIEKLYSLLAEMKQLSVFRDEEDDLSSGKNNGVCLDNMPVVGTAEIYVGAYWTTRNNEVSIGKVEGTD